MISVISSYFHDKVQKIKVAIYMKLNGVQQDLLWEDHQFSGVPLHDLTEVMEDTVWKLLVNLSWQQLFWKNALMHYVGS